MFFVNYLKFSTANLCKPQLKFLSTVRGAKVGISPRRMGYTLRGFTTVGNKEMCQEF